MSSPEISSKPSAAPAADPRKLGYEPPRIVSKRSVALVTLLSQPVTGPGPGPGSTIGGE